MSLRDRLPKLLLESFSILVAVLLALAVDEWRDDLANQQLAVRAEQSIRREIEENAKEIESTRRNLQEELQRLGEMLDQPSQVASDDLSVDLSLSLLSEAAWKTAQMTRAAHFMPFEKVSQISEVYDLQTLYQQRQSDMLSILGSMAEYESSLIAARALSGRLAIIQSLLDSLG